METTTDRLLRPVSNESIATDTVPLLSMTTSVDPSGQQICTLSEVLNEVGKNANGRKMALCIWCNKAKNVVHKIAKHQKSCHFNPQFINDPDNQIVVLYKCNRCQQVFTHLYYHKQHFVKNECGIYEKPDILYHCSRCKSRFTRKSVAIDHYNNINKCQENSEFPAGTNLNEDFNIRCIETSPCESTSAQLAEAVRTQITHPLNTQILVDTVTSAESGITMRSSDSPPNLLSNILEVGLVRDGNKQQINRKRRASGTFVDEKDRQNSEIISQLSYIANNEFGATNMTAVYLPAQTETTTDQLSRPVSNESIATDTVPLLSMTTSVDPSGQQICTLSEVLNEVGKNANGRKMALCIWCNKAKNVVCKIAKHQKTCHFNPQYINDPDNRIVMLFKCNRCQQAFTHLYYHKQHFVKNECGVYEKPDILYHCSRCKSRFRRKSVAIDHYNNINKCQENSEFPAGTNLNEDFNIRCIETSPCESTSAQLSVALSTQITHQLDTHILVDTVTSAEPSFTMRSSDSPPNVLSNFLDVGLIRDDNKQQINRKRRASDAFAAAQKKCNKFAYSTAGVTNDDMIIDNEALTSIKTLPVVNEHEPDIDHTLPTEILSSFRRCTRKRNYHAKTYYRGDTPYFIQDSSCEKLQDNCFNCEKLIYKDCCFKGFRLVKRSKYGKVIPGGFLDPINDPDEDDLNFWKLNSDAPQTKLNLNEANYILANLSELFFDICEQENNVYTRYCENLKKRIDIIWKPFVPHVREMCDKCDITIFNYHWLCVKCGYSLCIDCNQDGNELCAKCNKNRKSKLGLAQRIPTDILKSLKENVSHAVSEMAKKQSCSTQSLNSCAPHTWLCKEKILRLIRPTHVNNTDLFRKEWVRGNPAIFANVDLDMQLWSPETFLKAVGKLEVNPIDWVVNRHIGKMKLSDFFRRFKEDGYKTMPLKLSSWPLEENFEDVLPQHFNNFTDSLPLREYTHNGNLNLVNHLPNGYVKPDLGPKMFFALGDIMNLDKGTTNLHLDAGDALNVLVHVSIPEDISNNTNKICEALNDAGLDEFKTGDTFPGALWHIYKPADANKIRHLLRQVANESGMCIASNNDPIYDERWYLDSKLRKRLHEEYGVEGFAIPQYLGDAIFVPSGAPHQVRNIFPCIKIAEDFVAPENVLACLATTREYCAQSENQGKHHKDKLQIKNICFHAIQNAIASISLHQQ